MPRNNACFGNLEDGFKKQIGLVVLIKELTECSLNPVYKYLVGGGTVWERPLHSS